METPKPKNKGGRPPGATNRLAMEARQRAQETGLLPHEILLSIARGEPQPVYHFNPATGKTEMAGMVDIDVEQRKDAAKAAAPYFAPKISTVEVIRGVNDDELDTIIAELAAQTGIGLGTGGEGEEGEDQEGEGSVAAGRPAKRVRLI